MHKVSEDQLSHANRRIWNTGDHADILDSISVSNDRPREGHLSVYRCYSRFQGIPLKTCLRSKNTNDMVRRSSRKLDERSILSSDLETRC